MKRALIENLCISLALLGLVVFFELRGNREALITALGALLCLWKHSGRRRREDPPRGAPPAPLGGAAVPAALLLPLLVGCMEGSEVELRGPVMRVHTNGLVPPLEAQPLVPPIRADILQLTPAAPNSITCESGKVCIAASSSTGQAYFIDTTGAGLNAGDLRSFQSLGAAPSGSTGRVYYDTVLSAYRFYQGGVFGPLPAASGGTGVAGGVGANRVFASPNGSSGALAARLLVAADIPNLPASKITSGVLGLGVGGTGLDLTTAGQNQVFAGPVSGGPGAASLRPLEADDIPDLSATYVVTGRTITAGTGLSGGGNLTTNRTLSLATAGTAGTYAWPSSVTTDAYGRVTAVTATSSAAQNCLVAGPAAGGSGALSCRAQVVADLPTSAVTPGSYTSANITVDQYGRVVAASNGGGGGGSGPPLLPINLAEMAQIYGASSYSTGFVPLTLGVSFVAWKDMQATGIQTYWAGGGSASLKLSLYDDAGTAVATVTVSVSSAGLATGVFGSPVTLTKGVVYRAAAYYPGPLAVASFAGTMAAANVAVPTGPVYNGAVSVEGCWYVNADSSPTNSAGWTYLYPLAPVLSLL